MKGGKCPESEKTRWAVKYAVEEKKVLYVKYVWIVLRAMVVFVSI